MVDTAAAAIAFGFVYVHPFVDGNGRIHRWLIHHVLAAAGYNPPGIVFPINDIADHYRYFDATTHAEFLHRCVEQTVEQDLPREVGFLEAFDAFASAVKEVVEMPDRQVERLRLFLAQGGGTLSARAKAHEFRALTDDEIEQLQALYAQSFGADARAPAD